MMRSAMASLEDLSRALIALDRRGYPAYRSIRGAWEGEGLTLFVDHVQGDPFATPSSLRFRIPHGSHAIPEALWATPSRRTALADLLLDVFAEETRALSTSGSGGSGNVRVDAGGAEILARTGCMVFDTFIELRFRVGLPARGRSILGRAAADLLTRDLPRAARGIFWDAIDPEEARAQVELVEDHAHLQGLLAERGLVAFVRDGAILPRASGVSSAPLRGAVPFQSPERLRVRLPTLHHGEITGMGVPEGVTLLVGGGFHGKTTLLEALQVGVHPHAPGDGREWVVTRPDAVKVRSEDGRCVTGVDLRPFIQDLPPGPGGVSRDRARFSSADASGSTSLAAAILEAVALGARALLMDEDTCATNLLVRDARMQALVAHEPIVPFIDRARELYEDHGVSSVLALGGSGDYLDVATTVVCMESYRPEDVTERAREVAARIPTLRQPSTSLPPITFAERRPEPSSFDARVGKKRRVKSRGLRELTLGHQVVELGAVEQLVDDSQVRAIGALLERAGDLADGERDVGALVDALMALVEEGSLLAARDAPELAMPRRFELGAAIDRLRSLRFA